MAAIGVTSLAANLGVRLRILLVEDSAAQRLVLCRMLQALGHQVTQAANAKAGLSLADLQVFDAVLTDISLPGMSGSTMIQALRAKGGSALMIGMTAGETPVTVADAMLRKPITKQALLQALAGGEARGAAPGVMLLDTAHIAQLQANIGTDQVKTLLRRFMAEADLVCAQQIPDTMALHHLAGSAGMFGARALHAALMAGAWQTIWPATRAALLPLVDQTA